MASPSMTSSPSRSREVVRVHNESAQSEADLARSLNHLSIATPTTATSAATTRTPRSQKSYHLQQPTSTSRASSRSPLARSPSTSRVSLPPARSPFANPNGRESRSGTPTLLRKASLNSLHSAHSMTPVRAPSRRASSTNLRSPSATSALRSSMPDLPEKPPRTASSVARDHFTAELESHHAPSSLTNSETIVVLHDACYGHRFSRPRTSRAALSTIVERPERVLATVLGVSLAYVRLGERHADGLYSPHPHLEPAGIPDVPFLIRKSTRRVPLTSPIVTNVHGPKWMEELKIMCDVAESKLAINGKELQRPDLARGASDPTVPAKFHEGDLYLCAESLDAMEGALGAVCEAVDEVFCPNGPRRSYVAIRPPGHHCSSSFPSGFCWLNNVHIGVMHSILNHGATHAAIIDFDLHHGDGSQAIAWAHNSRAAGLAKNASAWKRTSIGYFSLHDINSYPCEYGDEEKIRSASLCIESAHGQNIWNVHLQPWNSEQEFWKLYEERYSIILDKCRNFLKQQTEKCRALGQKPRATIFLSAGFDASEWESSGMQRHNVNVPTDFYARITRDVVKIANEEGTSVEGRVISVMEGGYSDRALFSSTLSHLCGLAGDDPVSKDNAFNGLGYEMGTRISTQRGRSPAESTATFDTQASAGGIRPYDPSWWAIGELEEFEKTLAPPVATLSAPRHSTPPTYCSPTQASTAKVTSAPRIRRSVSGLSVLNNASRPPSPPPPEVPWPVAAHELSKLLIPGHRTTTSCTHEELAAEATRQRRDRQSVLAQANGGTPLPTTERAPTRMALRERKPKPVAVEEDHGSGKGRRKTVAALATERAPSRANTAMGRRQSSRRLSGASTVIVSSPAEVTQMTIPAIPESMSAPPARPESSMSARTTVTQAPPKRGRPPASAKKEPVTRAPRGAKNTTRQATAATAAIPVAKTAGEADVDALTCGMKKIKLTVLTKEQREQRARERAEGETKSVATAAAAAAALPTPSESEENISLADGVKVEDSGMALAVAEGQEKGKGFKSPTIMNRRDSVRRLAQAFEEQSPKSQHSPKSQKLGSVQSSPQRGRGGSGGNGGMGEQQLPPLRPFGARMAVQEGDREKAVMLPLPASSDPLAGPPEDVDLSMGCGGTEFGFVDYRPERQVGPRSVVVPPVGQQGLQWMSANVSQTPGPTPVKRGELPRFSSTGVIPFADPGAGAGGGAEGHGERREG